MRLAFCLFKYYPYGGLERDFLRIAQAAVDHGHEVQVYTMQWQGNVPKNLSVSLVPVFALTNHGRAKKFAQKIYPLLKKGKFDRIIGFNRLPGLDFYFAADPCYKAEALKKHGAIYRWLPRYRLYANFEKAVFGLASSTKIFLLNPANQAEFTYYYQTPASRFILLTPGISEDRQRPENQPLLRKQFREKMHIREDEKIILMVGSDFKRKGVDRTLLGLSALPEAYRRKTHLWIVGKGDSLPMENLAKKLQIHPQVHFWGPRDDIIHFYAAADVLLHPAYQETAGMVLLEALVAGLPVLVTANCGYAHYIQEADAGRVIPGPYEQQTLDQTLLTLLSNNEMLQIYRQKALDYAHTHDLFYLATQMIEVIENDGKK
jgi:UDP-glucose:(heptosyl)LPS alpha-1,3-glucosyltransferase